MPTVLIRGVVTATDALFELKGFTSQPVTSVFVEESILGRETIVPISGLGETTEPPPPVLSALLLGAPVQATELGTITTLSAELHDEDGNVVQLYDPDNWTWAVVSGGGSFGGSNNDDLTLPAAPVTVVIRATHIEEQLSATASISVVAVATFTPDFFSLPFQVIEGQQTSPLRSRVLDSDGSIAENIQTNWAYSVVSGPGVISGPAGNRVLTPNANSAPASITVRATYTGSLNVSPAFQDKAATIIEQPQPGEFPVVLQPTGHTILANFNGSTKNWSPQGWTFGGEWTNDARVQVVSDPVSKFGSAIEKRFFAGEAYGGWKGTTSKNIGVWRELYVRLVFAYASNWQWHPGGGKFVYLHSAGDPAVRRNLILGSFTKPASLNWGPGRRPGIVDFGSGLRQAYPTIPEADLSRGPYHTVEYLITADIGNTGGSLRMAVDGVIAGTYAFVGSQNAGLDPTLSNVDWLYSNATGQTDQRIGALCETWLFNGGSGGTVPGDTFIRLSEFYISGRS